MAFTAQQTIDLARDTLQDAAKTRMPDAEGLRYLNAGLQVFAVVRPDLFVVQGEITPTVGSAEQVIADADILAVQDIIAVKGANAVTICSLDLLNRSVPGWRREKAANPIHWMPWPEDASKRDARKYLLYPPPKTGVVLIASTVKAPADLLLANDVPLPIAYKDVLAHYIVYRSESKDDEHVLSARAATSLAFVERVLGVSLQSKVTVKEGKPT